MTTMNISLPEALKDFVDDQVSSRGYGTSSEYVRDLIRKDQEREKLRAMIMDGIASPIAGLADADWFDSLRKKVRQAASARK